MDLATIIIIALFCIVGWQAWQKNKDRFIQAKDKWQNRRLR